MLNNITNAKLHRCSQCIFTSPNYGTIKTHVWHVLFLVLPSVCFLCFAFLTLQSHDCLLRVGKRYNLCIDTFLFEALMLLGSAGLINWRCVTMIRTHSYILANTRIQNLHEDLKYSAISLLPQFV